MDITNRFSPRYLAACAAALSLSIGSSFVASTWAAVPDSVAGNVAIDGSSTVYPITEAVAEEFGASHPRVKVTVGIAGTGGGFKKFCASEIDLVNASRPIKESEVAECGKSKVEYLELPVAYDALTVVVHPKNTWATSITVAELKKIWEPEAQGKITRWNQIRADWPDAPLRLFGPGVDSGTYDYFTEAVVGKQHSSRGDFTSSEDDNVLVQGVAGDVNALGYFGMAYFQENADKLKAVPVDDGKDENGKGPQVATLENVMKGIYQPLARPLFVYVNKKAADRGEVKQFVSFYLQNVPELSKQVGYIPLSSSVYSLAGARFEKRVAGSVFAASTTKDGKGSPVGMTIEELLKKEAA
jgi:phosphate transport system substrate-binding protein